jgi:hypothetical protein
MDMTRIKECTPGEPIDTSRYRQLFIDDHIIEKEENIERSMHQLTRHSEKAIFPGQGIKPWERGGAFMRTAPQWIPDEKIYKIWCHCYEWTDPKNPSPADRFGPSHYEMAVSEDGIHWDRPELGIVLYEGQDTNIVNLGTTGGMWDSGVVYDPLDPDPGRRYKTLIWAPQAFGGYWDAFGWYPVYSRDGVNWSDAVKEQCIDNHDDAFTIYDEIGKNFMMPGKQWKADGNKMNCKNPRDWGIRTSTDFDNWTQDSPVIFRADNIDQAMGRERLAAVFKDPDRLWPIINRPEEYMTDIYEFAVFPYEGAYIAVITVFDRSGELPYGNQCGLMHLQLAFSRDLTNWIRLGNRMEFLEHSKKTMFDSGMILSTARPLIKDDEIWYYYTGSPQAHDTGESIVSKEARGIGLAKLRRDGFVSAGADRSSGRLMTVPVLLRSDAFYVNTDAKNGYIRVALIDPNGETIPGCGFDDTVPLTVDTVKEKVMWRGSEEIVKSQPVKVLFEINNAQLYSFWSE